MIELKLAIIGCGTVSQGLLEVIEQQLDHLQEKAINISIVAIADKRFGNIYYPEGLPIKLLLENLKSGRNLTRLKQRYTNIKDHLSINEIITHTNANVIIEATYTDIITGGAALTHHQLAFDCGKHVITSNKGPAVVAFKALSELAVRHNCFWGIEGSVLSGTPLIKLLKQELNGCKIKEISGIFNGTTNYILTEMTHGKSYKEALGQAQKLGYAEADPKADVEGFDILAKLIILSNVVFGATLNAKSIPCQGITELTTDELENAKRQGKIYKMVGKLTLNSDDSVTAKVSPECLPLSHALAQINGATNAISIKTDLLGDITVSGPGAGKLETGFALFSDLLALANYFSDQKFIATTTSTTYEVPAC